MSALDRLHDDLEESFRRCAGEYLKQARKAEMQNHPVEATICHHLATRLSKPITSLEEGLQLLAEWKELSSWLPVPIRYWKLSRVERKGQHVSQLRSLNLPQDDENALIESFLRRPGRSPAGREVAVRALELHMMGQTWKKIEPQLLPHRQVLRKPGGNISRQVRSLKKALKKHNVKID